MGVTSLAYQRGDVVWVDLDPATGSEINKCRPCLIVQRNAANETSPTTIVAPIGDARGAKGNVLNIFLAAGTGGVRKDSLVICNQIRTIDAVRIDGKLGAVPAPVMAAVEKGVRVILDL
ncbi:type II toxin-antitoxin system PemK/MazF family toxin [bacterium]|nr:MAG: type II toxin-antitoxin system PemK/MazF family toxin [bacterium]